MENIAKELGERIENKCIKNLTSKFFYVPQKIYRHMWRDINRQIKCETEK